jgi:hypothetical protein
MTMSTEENEFFKKNDQNKIADARRSELVAAIRQKEQAGVQAALKTNEDVAAEALDLGFGSDTARILPLVPLIHMAWIDGKVSSAENEKLRELAVGFGIEAGTPAEQFLELLLTERPSDEFFRRVRLVVTRLITEDPKFWRSESIIALCKEIAETSGSFFNLRNPINDKERALLEDFAMHFGVHERTAGDVVTGPEE